jgi:phosphoglycerate dehydrogenase-like enzyme
MSSKPVAAIVLTEQMQRQMFHPEDLHRLSERTELRGPMAAATPTDAAALLQDAEIAIAGWGSPRFDERLLTLAPKLKLLAYSAGSVKRIVSDALYDRGIRVTTAAAANAVPVAQFTVAMMVALLKQVPWLAAEYTAGGAKTSPRKGVSRELQDITVGIISASRVGREVIKLLNHYPRVQIRLFDPYVSAEQARAMGAEGASLEDVCRCDVVSIHAPNIAATRHMLNARTLSLLPDHAVLINTARGALIDETALVAEVQRRPLYVLLDVTDPEPPAADSPLRQQPNIILTPHIAGAMNQARRDMGRLAISETLRFLRGEPLQHEVTREMLPTQA